MVNQATALLIETGKAGYAIPLPANREASHALRGPHWNRQASAALMQAGPDDAEQLDLRIELGRTRLEPDDVQTLRKGSVVVFDAPTDEPVAIFAGARLIGRGEVVVVDGKIGVRVVELTE
jgi:flagellar motor switch protein FliN